jgi:hypothetical protein
MVACGACGKPATIRLGTTGGYYCDDCRRANAPIDKVALTYTPPTEPPTCCKCGENAAIRLDGEYYCREHQTKV